LPQDYCRSCFKPAELRYCNQHAKELCFFETPLMIFRQEMSLSVASHADLFINNFRLIGDSFKKQFFVEF